MKDYIVYILFAVVIVFYFIAKFNTSKAASEIIKNGGIDIDVMQYIAPRNARVNAFYG